MHTLLRLGMAALGIVAAYLSVAVLASVRSYGRDSQIALEFNTRKATHDFRILQAGAAVLFLGFLTYTAAGVTGSLLVHNVAEGLILLFFPFPIAMLWRWRRRL